MRICRVVRFRWLPFNVNVSSFDDQLADDSELSCFTLGSITLPDKKIKSNTTFVCRTFDKRFGLFLLRHLNWVKRYSTMKIGRIFFV